MPSCFYLYISSGLYLLRVYTIFFVLPMLYKFSYFLYNFAAQLLQYLTISTECICILFVIKGQCSTRFLNWLQNKKAATFTNIFSTSYRRSCETREAKFGVIQMRPSRSGACQRLWPENFVFGNRDLP